MNRDKKSLCLVCRELCIVGTPLLYKHMAVPIEALNDNFASTLSQPENHRGLSHVRTLCIGGGTNAAQRFHPSARDISVLCCLLSAIPQNILARFRYVGCVSSRKFPTTTLLTLFAACGLSRTILGVTQHLTYFARHNANWPTISIFRKDVLSVRSQSPCLLQVHWSTSQAHTYVSEASKTFGEQRT